MPTHEGTELTVLAHVFGGIERVQATFNGSMPFEADLLISGGSPGVASVTVLGPTSIRVNFAAAAVNNAALSNPDNYVITLTLTVFDATPQSGVTSGYVDLTITEQTTGTSYTVTLLRIEAA